MPDPLIELDSDGSAPVIRYDIPEPSMYTANNIAEVTISRDWWADNAWDIPEKDISNVGRSDASNENSNNNSANTSGRRVSRNTIRLPEQPPETDLIDHDEFPDELPARPED